jgi:hypothetical protein
MVKKNLMKSLLNIKSLHLFAIHHNVNCCHSHEFLLNLSIKMLRFNDQKRIHPQQFQNRS